MKVLLLVFLMLSPLAFAQNYEVPLGFYTGTGTWTDNFGGSGKWTMSFLIYKDKSGTHDEFAAQFDDGREYSGTTTIVFGQNSNFSYLYDVGGQTVTVGHGVSAPGSYQVTDLALDDHESITEFGDFSKLGVWRRWGRMLDSNNGRATLFEIKELKH